MQRTPLIEQESWLRNNHWHASNLIEGAINGSVIWACDFCIANNLAIKPDYTKQKFGLGGPIIAYVDKSFICKNCKQDFVFSALEQKYWYEDLGFIIDSIPSNCINCRQKIRKKKNAHKQLGIELKKVDSKDYNQLIRIADLYSIIGNSEKTKLFKRRAKNAENRNK